VRAGGGLGQKLEREKVGDNGRGMRNTVALLQINEKEGRKRKKGRGRMGVSKLCGIHGRSGQKKGKSVIRHFKGRDWKEGRREGGGIGGKNPSEKKLLEVNRNKEWNKKEEGGRGNKGKKYATHYHTIRTKTYERSRRLMGRKEGGGGRREGEKSPQRRA